MKNLYRSFPIGQSTIFLLFFSLLLSIETRGQSFELICIDPLRVSLDQNCMRSLELHEILAGIYDSDNLYTIELDKTPGSPACDGPWLPNSLGIGDLGQIYCLLVTYTVDETTCTANVEVMDSIRPSITCPGNLNRNVNAGQCTYKALGTEFDFTSETDNCPGRFLEYEFSGATTGTGNNSLANTVFNLGITTVTWRITDAATTGTDSCYFTISISANGTEICNNGLDDNCDGLVDQLHPTVSITEIINFFNAAVAAGTIVADGGGGNLNAFTNQLNQALNFAQPPPNLNQVLNRLATCLLRSDGAGSDWIKTGTGNGDDLKHLRELILFAKENFQCSGVPIPFAPTGGGGATQILSAEKSQTADRTNISNDSSSPQLFQNQPNPFSNETSIGFYLPSPMEARLSVFDLTGRLVFCKTATYSKGENVVTLSDKELSAKGVLIYRLDTPLDCAVRQMVRVE